MASTNCIPVPPNREKAGDSATLVYDFANSREPGDALVDWLCFSPHSTMKCPVGSPPAPNANLSILFDRHTGGHGNLRAR